MSEALETVQAHFGLPPEMVGLVDCPVDLPRARNGAGCAACASCRHPHRRYVAEPGSTRSVTFDAACDCGCTASGDDYDGFHAPARALDHHIHVARTRRVLGAANRELPGGRHVNGDGRLGVHQDLGKRQFVQRPHEAFWRLWDRTVHRGSVRAALARLGRFTNRSGRRSAAALRGQRLPLQGDVERVERELRTGVTP